LFDVPPYVALKLTIKPAARTIKRIERYFETLPVLKIIHATYITNARYKIREITYSIPSHSPCALFYRTVQAMSNAGLLPHPDPSPQSSPH
jgi:hypothetical protein